MTEFFFLLWVVYWLHRLTERWLIAPALDLLLDRIDADHEFHTPADHHLARYH